ncbi:MAG: hypothetical protein ABSG88_19145 [Bradyrhizobium sp.]
MEVTKWLKPSISVSRIGDSASVHPSHRCWRIYTRSVLGWKKLGPEQRLGSRIVTYADDLVILCKKGNADQALQQLRKIMSKRKLTVNEEKTYPLPHLYGHFELVRLSRLGHDVP